MPITYFTRLKLKKLSLYLAMHNVYSAWCIFYQVLRGKSRLCLMLSYLFVGSMSMQANTYYVDAQFGNDENNGTSSTFQGGNDGPWRTITQVNSLTFAPGDSILFKRGETWTDGPLVPSNGGAAGGVISILDQVLSQPIQLALVDPNNHQCIYFGTYGTGDKPKIDCQGGRKGIIIKHNYIIVEGLHLDNGSNNMLNFARIGGNYWNIVKEVDVTRCDGNAVRFSEGGGNCWLDGLYVYDYRVNGIYLQGSPFNQLKQVLVENCSIDNPAITIKQDAISCHVDDLGFNISGEIIIRNNTIKRSGEDGIDITSGTKILVEGNRIEQCLSGGIFVGKTWVNTVEVRGNFLNSNSISQGIGDLTIGSSNVRAVNNIIIGTGHHSLVVKDGINIQVWHNIIAPGNRTGNFIRIRDSTAQAEFKNNIFDFSATTQSISGSLDNHTFDNNCYYSHSPSQEIYSSFTFETLKASNSSFEPNGFWGDPSFVNPQKSASSHFQLLDNSPCLDQGASLPLEVDFGGKDRPQGGGADIGAFERATDQICLPISTICDDGDPDTANDVEDGFCNCMGSTFGPSEMIMVQISHTDDDVEERDVGGRISMESPDLELGYDGTRKQNIGIRFKNLAIEQGAIITKAYLQFTVDEAKTGPSAISVSGEASDNARAFTVAAHNVSTRDKVSTVVEWAVPDWPNVGEASLDQQSPDLSDIVQTIVNRPGWKSGNAMVFMLSGSGTRTAESYNGSSNSAPKLIIEYVSSGTNASRQKNAEPNEAFFGGHLQIAPEPKETSEMQLLPNPVDQALTVRILIGGPKNMESVHLSVYNLDGKIMREEDLIPIPGQWTNHPLDVSPLSPGFYFVSINTGTELLIKRLVKVKR